jgi:septum formation protein
MLKTKSPEFISLSTIDHQPVQGKKLILASSSTTRIKLLANAGLTFTSQRPNIDEAAEQNLRKHFNASSLALELAKLKAVSISKPQSYVLGADQTLDYAGTIYHKPNDKAEALQQLTDLRGQTHTLTSAIAITHQNQIIWQHSEQAHLTMRHFSDAFMKHYVEDNLSATLTSVGCYQLEGAGINLFQKIEGDYFTILGLPLLPCLAYLRQLGFTPS